MYLCMTEQRLRRCPTIWGSTRAMAIASARRVRSQHGSSLKQVLHDRFWLRPRTTSWRYGLLRFANKKQRAQRSGKPVLSYPRKRVSSGTRRGDARLAPGGSSKPPKFCQRRGILDARVRGHDTRETPHPGSGWYSFSPRWTGRRPVRTRNDGESPRRREQSEH